MDVKDALTTVFWAITGCIAVFCILWPIYLHTLKRQIAMSTKEGDTASECPSSLETDEDETETDGEDEAETDLEMEPLPGPEVDLLAMSKEARRSYLLSVYSEMRAVPGMTRAHAARILAAAAIPLNNNIWAEAQGAVAARFRAYEGAVQVPREQLELDGEGKVADVAA